MFGAKFDVFCVFLVFLSGVVIETEVRMKKCEKDGFKVKGEKDLESLGTTELQFVPTYWYR